MQSNEQSNTKSENMATEALNRIGELEKENKLLKFQLAKYLREQADPVAPKMPCRLVWIPNDKRFVFFCAYDDRDIPKLSGFMWDGDKKHWYTETKNLALLLAHHADAPTREALGL